MKFFIKLMVILTVLIGCSKVTDEGGPYIIKGRLLDNCENQQPIANQLLYFLVDVESDEESRVTYTDARGYFNYSFEGPPNNGSVIGGSIRIKNDKLILCGLPSNGFTADKKIETGTLYANPPRQASVTFNIKGNGYTNNDTVILGTTLHTDLRKVSTFKIAGPFNTGVTFTVEWLKFASSGVQTMPDYDQTPRPHVRRLKGTFGTLVRWQIIKSDGTLTKVERESMLLDVCQNEATLNIDLNQAE